MKDEGVEAKEGCCSEELYGKLYKCNYVFYLGQVVVGEDLLQFDTVVAKQFDACVLGES